MSDLQNPRNAYYPTQEPLDEEDEFLRELRQLAGMDEPQQPQPNQSRPVTGYSAPAAPKAEPRPAQPQYAQPARPQNPQPAPVKNPQPTQEPPAWEQNYPEPADSLIEERESLLPGWVKGLLLLTASAATLVLTVLAVLNGLQY